MDGSAAVSDIFERDVFFIVERMVLGSGVRGTGSDLSMLMGAFVTGVIGEALLMTDTLICPVFLGRMGVFFTLLLKVDELVNFGENNL